MASIKHSNRELYRAKVRAEFDTKGVKSKPVHMPSSQLPICTITVFCIGSGLYNAYKEGEKATTIPVGYLYATVSMRGSTATIEAVKRVLGEYCIINWIIE